MYFLLRILTHICSFKYLYIKKMSIEDKTRLFYISHDLNIVNGTYFLKYIIIKKGIN